MFSNMELAYGFIYVCSGLIAAGIILLFTMKLRHQAEQKQMEAFKEKHRDYFIYLQSHLHDDVQLALPQGRLEPLERRVVEDKLIQWIERLKGESRSKLVSLCQEAGFVEAEKRMLSSLFPGKRVEAAYRLGGMRAAEAVPEMLELLQTMRYGPESIIVARAIAKSADQYEFIRAMLKQLLASGKPVQHLAADMLLETRLESAGLLRRLLQEEELGILKAALAAMWGQAVPAVVPALGRLAFNGQEDVRAEAVKLYLASNPVLKDDTISQLMSDKEWEVRAVTAKALGRIHAAGSIPLLQAALADDSWHVRHNSAESLSLLGEQGFEALCQAALGAGAAREIALSRIEQVMGSERSTQAVDQIVAFNKIKLVYESYFGISSKKAAVQMAGVGGDYSA
ncbi:HEAT repeat domain-containing protein [Paenibacillus sp. F411]|uniref:PBS lyase HEAT domain protein repeat-containing protein n=1 Tax=Paenibacillus algicola TaxID=2565926 RepID=A0A4P8XJH4_9BACL|nr:MULTISPECIES: HEAT repeat domain-containing protein [Paenibacillus]MBO2945165.1 HEAT repeat domain-containing protein [Paenibacillus sp. F411]QCT02413.1 PBS lyase HEAT domain protein repeat-containing protein [Paenibacillus algicola]